MISLLDRCHVGGAPEGFRDRPKVLRRLGLGRDAVISAPAGTNDPRREPVAEREGVGSRLGGVCGRVLAA